MTAGLGRSVAVSRRPAIVLGGVALIVLVIIGLFSPVVALCGWLIGFAAVGSVPFGALALLAIHGLTGGRWGDVARPALLRAAAGLPVLLLLWLPLAAGARAIYPWAVDPATAGAGVAALYLNVLSFSLRSLVILAVLSGFAWHARRGPFGILPAGLCLLVYGAGMNLLAFDWLLSLDPHFNSSAIGIQLILTQLTAALAFTILVSDAPPRDRAWGDLAALLLATLLDVLYIVFMTFLIDWYGDLPDQAAWYLRRSRHGWLALEIAGLLGGAVLPLLALLFAGVRHAPVRLRLVAVSAAWGILAEMLWLAAPAAGGEAVLAGCFGCVTVGGFLAGLTKRASSGAPTHSWGVVADGR